MTRWLFLLLLLAASVAHARRPPDAALLPTVSVLTFSPGEIYWQRFGHNALLVREPGGEARVYNYGIFDFQQKNFFLNFARGAMLYRLEEQLPVAAEDVVADFIRRPDGGFLVRKRQ